MAAPSVTYTFSNGSAADATQVNQNFTDVINSLTDTTKSLSISALTLAGTFSPGGTLAASLVPASNNLYALGSSSLGYSTIYVGNGTKTVGFVAGALSASFSIITPTALPAAESFLTLDASGNLKAERAYSVGQQISSSCLTFSTTSTSTAGVSVTNLSVSITTSGRPVVLGLIPEAFNSHTSLISGSSDLMHVLLTRGGTTICHYEVGGAANPVNASPGVIYIDPVGAGTYTYALKIYSNGGATVTINYMCLFAYEL